MASPRLLQPSRLFFRLTTRQSNLSISTSSLPSLSRPLSSHCTTRTRNAPTSQHLISTTRPFTTSPPLLKKGNKQKETHSSPDSSSSPSSSPNNATTDPFNISTLEDEISKAIEKLKTDISKLRSGGRFNHELVEALRVPLAKGGKETVRLSELAQVIPKGGRSLAVLVGDEEHVKPVSSAIASSPYSLNPQVDAHNPLQLTVPIPPPTQESRQAAVQTVKKAAERAGLVVREARGAQQKKFKKMTVRPDDLKRAHDIMEKVARAGQEDVKSVLQAAVKALEQG